MLWGIMSAIFAKRWQFTLKECEGDKTTCALSNDLTFERGGRHASGIGGSHKTLPQSEPA